MRRSPTTTSWASTGRVEGLGPVFALNGDRAVRHGVWVFPGGGLLGNAVAATKLLDLAPTPVRSTGSPWRRSDGPWKPPRCPRSPGSDVERAVGLAYPSASSATWNRVVATLRSFTAYE